MTACSSCGLPIGPEQPRVIDREGSETHCGCPKARPLEFVMRNMVLGPRRFASIKREFRS